MLHLPAALSLVALVALGAVACGGSAVTNGDPTRGGDSGAGGDTGAGGYPSACLKGQSDYRTLWVTLLAQPSATACQFDADCTLLAGNARCGDGCGATPLSAAAKPAIEQKLLDLGNSECSTCPVFNDSCIGPTPACVAGKCVPESP